MMPGSIKLMDAVVLLALIFHPLCALSKTYNVNNTGLADHSNVNVSGTIARALAQAESDGGGIVIVGAGQFRLNNSIYIGHNVTLSGSGPGATRLFPTNTFPVITNIANAKQITLSSFGIDMPYQSGAAISLTEAGLSRIEDIDIVQADGGDPSVWMVEIINTNRMRIDSMNIDTHSNGLRFIHNDIISSVRNFGDSTLTHIDIRLNEDHTTGMMFAGSVNNLGLMNNISASRVEVARRAGISGGEDGSVGTVGIHLLNSSRCSVIHGDIEGLERPIVNEGKIGLGGGGESNAFFHVFSIGGGSPAYTGINDKNTLLLGGDGEFLADSMQRLPLTVSVEDKRGNMFPISASPLSVESHYDDYTVKLIDNRKIFTNEDATGTITFTLPDPPYNNYLEFTFVSTVPQSIKIRPQPDSIIHGLNNNPDSIGMGKSVISPAGRGYAIRIINTNHRRWQIIETTGSWNKGN